MATGTGSSGVSPCSASRASSTVSPAASSLIRRRASRFPSRSARAMSWWSSAQSIPQYTSMHPPFSSMGFAVRAGPSRAGHARSLMEGLKGTAIRSAVRDPGCRRPRSCPGLSGSGVMRSCSCEWLRPRPPIPPQMVIPADPGRRVADRERRRGLVPGPGSCHRAQGPPDSRTGSPGTSPSSSRSCRSAPGHPPCHERRRHESGRQAPRSSGRAPASQVQTSGDLSYAH